MFVERRKHRRILTLKNFARFLALMVVFLAGLSLEVHMRDHPGDYGRLMRKEVHPNTDIRPHPEPVKEAPVVADQTVPDPMLVAPAAREQEFLSVAPRPVAPPPQNMSDVRVVGDSSGVVIQRASDVPKRPVLAGGIFKQP